MDEKLCHRWAERAYRRTEGAGLRTGTARTAVIDTLASDGQCLLTAQEITERVRARGRGSAASVYRIIDELFALGLLHRLDGRDGVARYEIADPENHHHHFVDETTGTVEAFADADLEQALEEAASRLGIELTGHEIVLRGTRSPG